MRADRKNLSDGELRKLLNLGDPAGDEREPSRDEVAAMRRTVLNAVDARAAAHPWLSRSLATAVAMFAVAVIALAILLQAGPWGEVLQPETGPVTPAEPAPVVEAPEAPLTEPSPDQVAVAEVPSAGVAEVEITADDPQAIPYGDPLAISAANQQAVAATDPQAISTLEQSAGVAEPTVERQARTVQFTAPGGTRIVWTLDPDFRLPVSEPDTGARGEL